jgi:hypothetical protein
MVARKIRPLTSAPFKGGSRKQSHQPISLRTRRHHRESGAIFLATDLTDELLFAYPKSPLSELGRITVMFSASAGFIAIGKDGNEICELGDDLDGLPEHILSRVREVLSHETLRDLHRRS